MLRDPHQRINTTSFGHSKVSPYQQRVRALVANTPFKAMLLNRQKSLFLLRR
jgi:hypothetical protein